LKHNGRLHNDASQARRSAHRDVSAGGAFSVWNDEPGIRLHIQHITHSYTYAGLALGFETAGVAISGPLLGRWMGTFGASRMLITTSLISASAIFAIALAPVPGQVLVALCLIVGLSSLRFKWLSELFIRCWFLKTVWECSMRSMRTFKRLFGLSARF